MTLNAKSLGLAGGVLWGTMMLIMTLLAVWAGYGTAMLNGIASIYPGYSIGYLGALVGLVYGFVDGFIGMFVLAWLYNKFD